MYQMLFVFRQLTGQVTVISGYIILQTNLPELWARAGGHVSSIAHEAILPKIPDDVCGRFWNVSTNARLCAGYNLAHKGICRVRMGLLYMICYMLILALRLELVIAYQVSGDYSSASVTV